ncbi:hypothetical protein KL930_004630 [Ogataea haglerorum]|uniref:Gluconokinase n=1 Tax=Ogataea haglerorum TaxID=1937702 RepID=A0AAN6HZ48_9ASCO|nr:uncharacterized protein KL911_000460 [Ogataea haglerorum]KAG7699278.1 hypothetical protein KL915_001570 [Ogataea haglerorum]KAG7710320.1 hypothetical protein KL914_001230 [Ogataea haglerorum]KAG7710899.1 hypothetical protein KL950_000865 [Ogataea haglerorum]KAG7714649.1 hypothetical protein KL913_004419 [Ogataea haglerorum]KAG7715419.1 hypothetical protein KL949_004333 [Ogataea haglerorum]
MAILIVVGGPSGTGKSTVGERLSKDLDCPYVEGDSYHPQSNIDKMSQGIPLTDDDRWAWLEKLTKLGVHATGPSGAAVVTCSMLKLRYREYIKKIARLEKPDIKVLMLFLYNDYDIIYKRMSQRAGHFMKSSMLKSQFDDMEIPKNEEGAFAIYCGEKSQEAIGDEVLQIARQVMTTRD